MGSSIWDQRVFLPRDRMAACAIQPASATSLGQLDDVVSLAEGWFSSSAGVRVCPRLNAGSRFGRFASWTRLLPICRIAWTAYAKVLRNEFVDEAGPCKDAHFRTFGLVGIGLCCSFEWHAINIVLLCGDLTNVFRF